MATRKAGDEPRARENGNGHHAVEDEDGPRIKISVTIPQEVLDRVDAYRKRRGGLNRSAFFALAADWFMDENPLKNP
ncbi:ribbon-helix-helix protein, CopG family [Paraburkholderia mimosarum]|uniref:ribbon-helix-helix protein, CopG family n=1 Tax=Paraburkholderia mimosarum TaxID=312026 RepID=UPI0003F81118|nr:ribbon-helix-helix protein, CopG family [Paraburkholderia mimosarum]